MQTLFRLIIIVVGLLAVVLLIENAKADALICKTLAGHTEIYTLYQTAVRAEGPDDIIELGEADSVWFYIKYYDQGTLYLDRSISHCLISRGNIEQDDRQIKEAKKVLGWEK